jgi:UDP-N-acetylglucosamine--N-acetylmuramyl-(pentapeptide) pyrophosphoryl-undecaprenol N-acetylglucosamine transferase
MTNYLLTGGGTAGHVNPLLTVATALRERNPNNQIYALGTSSGLETKLVPAAGFELLTIDKVPFPRRPGIYAVVFPFRFLKAVRQIEKYFVEKDIQVVVGFGGYVSAPAYLAAKRKKLPIVIHEANALPGIANRWGNRFASAAGKAFRTADLPNSDFVGLPIRKEIIAVANQKDKKAARRFFGLDPDTITLLVTGGSLGAKSINQTIDNARGLFTAAGIQILHIIGGASELDEISEPDYKRIRYCSEMEKAIAAADFAVSRAGAATVSEFCAVGLPALYIPYSVGNGEQKFNIQELLAEGGGLTVEDDSFDEQYVRSTLIPIVSDGRALLKMAESAKKVGVLDGTERFIALIDDVMSRR